MIKQNNHSSIFPKCYSYNKWCWLFKYMFKDILKKNNINYIIIYFERINGFTVMYVFFLFLPLPFGAIKFLQFLTLIFLVEN